MSDKTRKVLIIIAACVLVLCVVWYCFRGSNSQRTSICAFLSNYGYNIYEDDLLIVYDNSDTTIREALFDNEYDLDLAKAASEEGGFPTRMDKRGGVTLMLATDGEDTVYIWIVDGEKEMCFVQTSDGTIKAIGK